MGYLLNPYMMKSLIFPTYGTGSSNNTQNFYTDQLYISTTKVSSSKYTGNKNTAMAGNCYNSIYEYGSPSTLLSSPQVQGSFQIVYGGTNTYNYSTSANSSNWIGVWLRAGGGTTGINVGSFQINVGGTAYTVAQCISNNYIEPLVLTNSNAWSTSYYWSSAHLFLTGNIGAANYPQIFVMFKPKVTTLGIRFYSSATFNTTYDGMRIQQFTNLDISLTPFDYA